MGFMLSLPITLTGGASCPAVASRGLFRYPPAPSFMTSPFPGPSQSLSDMKTISAKAEGVKRDWYVVDATDKTLGRLCTELAHRLRGKHKPIYTPHVDTGDYLVVINAEKIAVTGNKLEDKNYHRFTGYVGNLKTTSLKDMLAKHPERVIEIGVKGMLPKNPLGRAMYRKLKVYAGANHPHTAQQPQVLDIKA
ncbi:hypothetical protein GCM10009105_22160 [Dokdonella soli]|uniref:Large ribosomal subunit protein uL13 n=2 Tax=Dokdonella soli TaxID=529810 RepID=A0ABN1IKB1_9GAMM